MIQDFKGNWSHLRYNSKGQRVYYKRNQKVTLYYGDHIEISYQAGRSNLKKIQYYYAGPILVARKNSSGTYWYHQDNLGSTRLMTNKSGKVIAKYNYLPFGEIASNSGTVSTDIQFTGHRTDSENELIYMNARYYDPHLARFISATLFIPDNANPQSLNRYSYVINNPAVYRDPTGHDYECQSCSLIDESLTIDPEFLTSSLTFDHESVSLEQQAGDIGCQSCSLIDASLTLNLESLKFSFNQLPTPRDAALFALSAINPKSIAINKEFVGYIFRNRDGTYSSTAPVEGRETTISEFDMRKALGRVPYGLEIVSMYHTHADWSPYSVIAGIDWNERFSEADLEYSQDSFAATPNGRFLAHYPSDNVTTTSQPGVIPVK